MPLTIADIIIIILLLLFAIGGLRRGFVWEIMTAIGLLLGLALTYYYRADLLDLIMRLAPAGWGKQWGAAVVFLLFFLIVYLGFTAIGKYLHDHLHKTAFKWPDRILGVVAGVFKGALLIGLLVVVVELLSPTNPVRHALSQSQIVRWGKHITYGLVRWEPPSKRRWVEIRDESRGMRDEFRKLVS